jgi:hypothetical protein
LMAKKQANIGFSTFQNIMRKTHHKKRLTQRRNLCETKHLDAGPQNVENAT